MSSNQRIADKSMQKVTSRKKELGVQAHCCCTTTVNVGCGNMFNCALLIILSNSNCISLNSLHYLRLSFIIEALQAFSLD